MDAYKRYVSELTTTLNQLPWERIDEVATFLYEAWLNNKQVFVMGNGGSAATASHFACDMGKNTVVAGQRRLRILALTDNMALFSAYANDEGYERVFADQLSNFVQEGDVVIGISTSGNSENVIQAIELARACRATTIGWTGHKGGRLASLVDVSLVVPNECIEQIEDVHLILEHMITTYLRERLRQVMLASNHAN